MGFFKGGGGSGFPLAAPQAGTLANHITLVANTNTTIFTLTLGVGTWFIDYDCTIQAANAAGSTPFTEVLAGTATAVIDGSSDCTEAQQPATGTFLKFSCHARVVITAPGTILLKADSPNADVVQGHDTGLLNATGYRAQQVA